jgi:hypothetical protein
VHVCVSMRDHGHELRGKIRSGRNTWYIAQVIIPTFSPTMCYMGASKAVWIPLERGNTERKKN